MIHDVYDVSDDDSSSDSRHQQHIQRTGGEADVRKGWCFDKAVVPCL